LPIALLVENSAFCKHFFVQNDKHVNLFFSNSILRRLFFSARWQAVGRDRRVCSSYSCYPVQHSQTSWGSYENCGGVCEVSYSDRKMPLLKTF